MVTLAIGGILLIIIQRQLFSYIGSYIGHAFLLLAIWLWVLRQPTGKKNSLVSFFDVFGEQYSMYVYLFHVWVYGLMDNILRLKYPSLVNLSAWGWIRPFAACALSAAFAVVLKILVDRVTSLKTRLL